MSRGPVNGQGRGTGFLRSLPVPWTTIRRPISCTFVYAPRTVDPPAPAEKRRQPWETVGTQGNGVSPLKRQCARRRNPMICERPASRRLVDRAGFEPAYGKPGQIYSLLKARRKPPFLSCVYGLCTAHAARWQPTWKFLALLVQLGRVES